MLSQNNKGPLTVIAEEHGQDTPPMTGKAHIWRPEGHLGEG